MATQLTCPNGHQWNPAAANSDLKATDRNGCPICSLVANQAGSLLADGAAQTVTLPPAAGNSDAGVMVPPGPVPREAATPPPAAVPQRSASPLTIGGLARAEPPSAGPAVAVPGYEIERELGRGGMGVVYQARHLQLGRTVALKMILAGGHAGAADLVRFRTEAETIARLQHPNIVQVFEVGEHDGLSFLALEYCPGGSLDGKLAGTPLPPYEAAQLVEQLARAIQAAHAKGVIHRDLKPANVLLGEGGTPKVTDFGLARKLDEAGHTATGAVLGTPSYMAPEQAGGRTKEQGPACDIYALGAVLYECLTGHPPFKAATPLETLMQVVRDEPVPPTQLQPRLPRDLETVCLKCLRKEPAQRYATAAEVAADLGRFQRGESVRARPVGRAERAWRWCRRNSAIALLTAAIVLSLLAGTAVASYFAVQAMAQAKQAREQADQAHKEKQFADRRLYVAQMNQTQRAWEDSRFALHQELLASQRPERTANVDLRGFEWHYWYRLRHSDRFTLGRQRNLSSVAFSPDGRLVASGTYTYRGHEQFGEVKIWDALNGQERLSLKAAAVSLVFSPDGRRLAGVGSPSIASGVVTVVDTSTGRQLLDLKVRGKRIASVAFSPDGHRLAGATGWFYLDATRTKVAAEVKVWDAASGKEQWSVQAHAQNISHIAFSPDGKWLASASMDGLVKVWDAATGQEKLTYQGHKQPVKYVLFHPGGEWLVSVAWNDLTDHGWESGELKTWDLATGAEQRRIPRTSTAVGAPAFSGDGKKFALAAGTVEVWDLGLPGRKILSLKGAEAPLALNHDGTRLASASWGSREVSIWDVTRPGQEAIRAASTSAPGYRSLAVSADGGHLAGFAGNRDYYASGTVTIWEAATGKQLLSYEVRPGNVADGGLAFRPDGKRLATASGGDNNGFRPGEVKIWDTSNGQMILALQGPKCFFADVAYRADGKQLATIWGGKPRTLGRIGSPWDGLAQTRDAETGQVLREFPGVNRLLFGPDGKYLALAKPGEIALVEVSSGVQVILWEGKQSIISGLAFNPDGTRLAAAISGDPRDPTENPSLIKVWELPSGKEACTLTGHAGWVHGLAFNAKGDRLAGAIGHSPNVVARTKGEVKLWDMVTGQEVLTLKGHTAMVTSVVFSPRGHRLFSAGSDHYNPGEVLIWDADSAPWRSPAP